METAIIRNLFLKPRLTMYAVLTACMPSMWYIDAFGAMPMDAAELEEFAQRYTAAWCSQNAASVAVFFAEDGSITVNGEPSVGREAITEMAQGFMTAFPDLKIIMDDLDIRAEQVIYRWTFIGTNTGPEGTGKSVRFSGYEEWTFGDDGLVMKSMGHFDDDEYQYQLEHGVE